MFLGAIGRLPKPPRIPSCAKRSNVYNAPPPSYSLDFTTASTQDPLSDGGKWSNNTQGVGGNIAPGILSNIRVIAAASGGINIASGDSVGQSAPPASADYMDSFAFKPGYPGNMRVTATVYFDTGYVAGDTHELELILGCVTASGSHHWIENNWNAAGARQMISLNGGAGSFTVLSPTDSGAVNRAPQDGDVWVAELYRSTNTIVTKVNGTQILSLTDATYISNLGDGGGIATFRRTALGSTAANRMGFRNFLIEPF